jgi:Uma2 family endonuclease
MSTERARLQFTTDHVERMVATGILNEDDRVELIDGDLVTMSPIGNHHAYCVNTLNHLLVMTLHTKALISVQNSVELDLHNLPQPDLVALKARRDRYRHTKPQPSDIFLVIEVSDSTVRYDRMVKMPLYARFGIREAWLIDLPGQIIEIYTHPRDGVYRRSKSFRPGETVQSVRLPELSIAANELLL